MWTSLDEAKEQILCGLQYCDILKISDNEIEWLTGLKDFDDGVKWIRDHFPQIQLILVSMGKDGSRAYTQDRCVVVPAYIQANTIETTGAGDTFCACVLNYCLEHGVKELSNDDLSEMLHFANAAASIVTTRRGALRVMPEKAEVISEIWAGSARK